MITERCSDHSLEIEKGRHKKIPRRERFWKLCSKDIPETEKHLLLECKVYEPVKVKHNIIKYITPGALLMNVEHEKLEKYFSEAFALREDRLKPRIWINLHGSCYRVGRERGGG